MSRSYYSDEGDIRNVYKDSKCIKGKSCCNKDTECYPAYGVKDNIYPKTVYATCKPCPLGLLDTYTFNRGNGDVKYLSNIGGFYTNENGKPIKDSEKVEKNINSMLTEKTIESGETVFKDGYKKTCKACNFHAGCRYDKKGNPRNTHFEAQQCINGNDRVCKPCSVCNLGTEFAEIGCGEGGSTVNTKCAKCTPCKKGTFKAAGCSIYNSFFDNHCIPMSNCKGKPKESNTYEDPGEGNRFYEIEVGFPGSHMLDSDGVTEIGSGKGGTWDGDKYINGKKLDAPYFGQDRRCRKCDICPEGTNMIGEGCMGLDSTTNTICQRLINVDKYVDKLRTCPSGKYYNRDLLRKKLTYNHNLTKEENISNGVDERVATFYDNDKKIREEITKENEILKENKDFDNLKNINDLSYYEDNEMPEFSDEDIISMACEECKKCIKGTFQNPKNTGCEGADNTNCIPKTICKNYEIIESEGDDKTDRKCGPCKCLPQQFGLAKCEGNKIISGCKDRTECKIGEYKFDNPVQYGDVTKDTICKKCKKCPPNSFKLAECNNSTDTVCKNHRQCGNNQYVVKKGTDLSDTICKCIDGYELPMITDKSDLKYGTPNLESNDCEPSKGKCWSNPCHPNAKCYDRFKDNGDFLEYVCRCNKEEGYGETEKLGKGVKGCRKIPTEHSHNFVGLEKTTDYGLTEKINKIMTHVDSDYHLDLESKHLHKN